MKPILILFLLGLIIAGCGKVKAGSGATATELLSPAAGFRCFAIVDESGHTVGGSCVKD